VPASGDDVTISRPRRQDDFAAEFYILEQRSASLRMASVALREKSKVLLEPRHYAKQKLCELQARQRSRYQSMSDDSLSSDVRQAVRQEFAEGEAEITRLLLEIQRQEYTDGVGGTGRGQ